jgi:hypothetical protein
VIGVRISERDAIISYLESPDDPVRDQETHMVRNPNGIVFNIQPGSSRFDEVAVKTNELWEQRTTIRSQKAPLTCTVTGLNKNYGDKRTIIDCSADTREVPTGSILSSYGGFSDLPDTTERSIGLRGRENLQNLLGTRLTSSKNRPELIQLANRDQQETNYRTYTQRYFVEDALRQRIAGRVRESIEDEARRNVDEIPDVVYRKVNSGYLYDCLANGGCVNSSGLNSWQRQVIFDERIKEDPRNPPQLSFSEEYLDQCDIKTPMDRKEVTMVMKIPRRSCPLRLQYPGDEVIPPEKMDEHYYYPVAVRSHIDKTNPMCNCIDEHYVRSHGQSPLGDYRVEKEIIITECDSSRVRFDVDDILHLVVDTQCGVDVDKIRDNVSRVAPEYADRVISHEEWKEKYAGLY